MFIASYLEITCVYYILLDNHDLQSCQVGQGKDMAITTPVQSTLRVLGHQAVPRLASGLDSMWPTSTRGGFWSKWKILWFGLRLLGNVFSTVPGMYSPRVTTSWGLNTLRLNIISKLFDRTTSQWNGRFLCRNSQLAPLRGQQWGTWRGAHGANIWMVKWPQNQNYGPPDKPLDCPSLEIPGE